MIVNTLHPVLNYFYETFITNHTPEPSGMLIRDNMDEFTVGKQLNLKGAYWVCAKKIKFAVAESINITGPGGSLLAGKEIELEGPEINLMGSEEDPVQIVALENISIKANDLKIKNVVFFLFNGATLSIVTPKQPEIENVRVVRLTLVDQELDAKDVAFWNNTAAFMGSNVPQLESTQFNPVIEVARSKEYSSLI